MAGISSKAAGGIQNKYKFNGGNELQSAEFSDGSGMELYNAIHRMYDPQLGRFWQVDELAEANWEMSPYNFASDNPINFNDPLGLADADPKDDPTGELKKTKTLSEVVVKSVKKLDQNQMQSVYWNLRNSGKGFGGVSDKLRERLERWDGVQRFMERVHAQQKEEEMLVLEIASNFIPLGWITKLKYVKYAANLFKLKRGIATAKLLAKVKPLITVLGKAGAEGIGGYEKVAAERGYNSFEVAPEVWSAMSRAERYSANMKFLADVVARGDEIVFSKRVAAISGETGMFREELEFLSDKGYKLATDGLSMIK